ncbi:unnamed protein product [Orchesella dallaii]|uniref:Acyl-CoA-binding domain-containing protein 6 n=1 Tax=Orchesella dallaii TaxID=48710 RepID=A0ABP1S6D0_9HEXA
MSDVSLPKDEILQILFDEAANVVQHYATAGPSSSNSSKPTDSQLLDLYGLYKVAMTGSCNEPQPGIFNMRARSKWNAWKNKSHLTQMDAMQEYVSQVMEIYSWQPLEGPKKKTSGGFAPAVSRPHVPEEVINDKDTPFGWVKDNEISKLAQWIAAGNADVNLNDEEGLTLLHWAADRGRTEVCEILLKAGANPELKDEDEQTPLDYATTCEHDDIIQLLQRHLETGQRPT